jgi:hypothetical protein
VNTGNKEGRGDQDEEGDEECCHIEQQDERDVQLHRGCRDIIVSGVELDEPCMLL